MKNIFLSAMFFLLFGISAGIAEAVTSDIMLTSPEKDGGISLFKAIEERSSATQKAFKERNRPKNFYPALGRDREEQDGKGWTVPSQ